MRKHFCTRIDGSEASFNDIAKRTKIFMLQEIFASFIENYTIVLEKINQMLLEYYSVMLVLEDEESLEDLIEGVQ